MRKTVPVVTFALVSLAASFGVRSEEKLSKQEILSIAKLSGACGVFKQMATFQESTQLVGGNEFAARFLMAEAARLGKSPEEYVNQCNKATAVYEKLWGQQINF